MELSQKSDSSARLLRDDKRDSGNECGKQRPFTRREIVILVSLGLNNLLLHICVSIMAPVFPVEVKKVHPRHSATSSFAIGMVFSVATLADFIAAPLLGKEVSRSGARLLIVLGTFIVSGVTILFAFMMRVDDWTTFLGLCYTLRITKGFGAAMVFVSSFSILTTTFPDKISSVSGMLEVFSGLGFVIGPAIGGVLYEKVGFAGPFLISGCILLAGTVALIFLLPRQEHRLTAKNTFSSFTILRQPRAFLLLVISFWTQALLGFFEPTLGPFLHNKLGLSPSKVGICFLAGAGTYAVVAPFVGYFADHHVKWPIIPCGLVITAAGYLVVDLNGILDFSPKLWHTLVGFAIIGIGVSLASVPASGDIIHTLEDASYRDSQALDGAVGGLLGSAASLGSAVGPALGGMLTGVLSFGNSGLVFGAVTFLLALFLLSHTIYRFCTKEITHARAELERVKGHLIPSGRSHFTVDFVRISGLFGGNTGQHSH